jgi:hypothetical protein
LKGAGVFKSIRRLPKFNPFSTDRIAPKGVASPAEGKLSGSLAGLKACKTL